jgi:FkbM family methyltransferase|tara:strand:- start:4033 stop:4671 length:639 start_codon:yes stop_codon:yes gene_type:complete
MIEQLSDGLWVPSTDAQIEQWREKGYPHMQDKCLKQFVKWCEKNNKKFSLILDIGAWCGTWSMAMQKYADEIYCYEPNKIHFECLIKNLKTFQHIKLHNHAVGNRDGKIKLTSETATQNTRVLLEEGETVILKLDSMDIHNPDMLKIDVEGLEMEVLKGGHKLLENIEFVMIELNNNSKKYGSSNKLIQKHMKNLGFKELIKTWPDIVYRKA